MTIESAPPIVRELIKLLPPADAAFPPMDRMRWLKAAEAIFNLVYREDVPVIFQINLVDQERS
jgi:hypothetical protein